MGRNLGQSAVHYASFVSSISTLLSLHSLIVKQSESSVSEMPKISLYKSLNDLSTADFYTERTKKKKTSRFYEIERVVSTRIR